MGSIPKPALPGYMQTLAVDPPCKPLHTSCYRRPFDAASLVHPIFSFQPFKFVNLASFGHSTNFLSCFSY
jgi:hypothetical protein